MSVTVAAPVRPAAIWAAFAIVYLVWGSTYLAIRVGVTDLPPFLFAGVRFLAAAAILLLVCRWRRDAWPRGREDWRRIVITAVLMLVGANGMVTWAEQWVPSNQAALIVATSALWMAAIGSLGGRGERVNLWTRAGLLLGFGGVGLLVAEGLNGPEAPILAYAMLALSPLLWAAGSIFARRYPPGGAPLMVAALQMLVTGLIQTTVGLSLGEAARWQWTPESFAALAYLTVFGSCIAYGAYYWLVHQVTPSQLGTYAYVNPAVAVLLGWVLLGETLNPPQVLGTVVILLAVMVVTWAQRTRVRA